jgi:hypothetical protein
MPDPSPTTASIVQAFDDRYELLGPFEANWQEVCIAAVLRAAADQVDWDWEPCLQFHDIAAEMEAKQ